MKKSRTRFLGAVAVTGVAALLTTSCSSDSAAEENAGDGTYPITIQNCGDDLTVDKRIESAVSLDQGVTEILLTLGLQDRMSGTATWTDPVHETLVDANAEVPRLSENIPSLETVLEAGPDFVAASFYPTLAESGGGGNEKYREVGIPAYLAYTDCTKSSFGGTDGERDTQVTMEDVYQDVRDLATLFDVKDAGDDLVADLESRMTAAQDIAKVDDVTAAFWFSDSEAPYMAGGLGTPQLMSDALGVTNVFADNTEEWPQVSWEALVDKNPDVLVIGDLTRDNFSAESAEAKIEFLKGRPVTSKMDAVKNERFVVVAGADMNPSIRTVEGIEKLATGLEKFDLGDD